MEFLNFHLSDDFIAQYKDRSVHWGFNMGASNTLGELTFLTKYSRKKPDGTKERWYETCRRCIEGMYSILKDHCSYNKTYWNEQKAQRSAQEAYERMFDFKWTPPGRGLAQMGTALVHQRRDSASLNNCSFVSTEKLSSRSVREATLPFTRLMEMSMLGVGVGFDTRGADKLTIHKPLEEVQTFVVPDTREGWVESFGLLLESYFFENRPTYEFDYSEVRPEGSPIKTFGGIAPGPGPLKVLHDNIRKLFKDRIGTKVSSSDIVDICNMAGKCVVSGGIRRTAEIAFGDFNDKEFLNLKNYDINPERMGPDGWGYTSNNSVFVNIGDNVDHLIENIIDNGEPGLFYLDIARKYGRLIDPPTNRDYRVMGCNPCAEQSLEDKELCTLVEVFIPHHDNMADFIRSLKYAYLYGKAVTLLPTPWPESNEVMQRNRRIGCSISGLAQFAENKGWIQLREWLNKGYDTVQQRDQEYSEWLGIRESIKTTSVKPSGTVSLLAGVTPGVHWPTNDIYIRRMRLQAHDPFLKALQDAGYHIEPDVMDPSHTMVAELPTRGPQIRTEKDVTVWEKAELAVLLQRYWADNQVSATLTFKEEERDQIGALLHSKEGQLKSISLLPIIEQGAYQQMPYEAITEKQYNQMVADVKTIDWDILYNGAIQTDAEGDRFCSTDRCELKSA